MSAKPELSTTQLSIANTIIRWMSWINTRIYDMSGGRIGGRFFRAPVLLLTTVGRKSGERRTTPLLYLEDAGRIVVVASKGGLPHHPHWYLNLVANADVDVQIGRSMRAMTARTADSVEKDVLWPKLVAMYKDFQAYQDRTARDIPVVILTDRP